MKINNLLFWVTFTSMFIMSGLPTAAWSNSSPEKNLTTTENEAFEIGVEAYHYFYSLVMMDATRRVTTNLPPNIKPGLGPFNQFNHLRAFPTAEFREVVRPNFDTLYSSAWLDLAKEPLIISVPDTHGRYFLLPMLDMWTDIFASPGKRTSGTSAQNYAIALTNWHGKIPTGVERIDAPTRFVWVIGRVQTNGVADYTEVHKIQDALKITPLSRWGKLASAAKFEMDPQVDMKTPPMDKVNGMSAREFFTIATKLLKDNPPHMTDWSQVARLERIGIKAGTAFDFDKLPAAVKAGLERAPATGMAQIKAKIPTLARVVNGWQMNTDTMGVYGNFYLKRAIVALTGLGANVPEDAIYPLNLGDANNEPLTGDKTYVMHFAKEVLPPVGAFWSVTMYDESGYQVANKINRFAIGDRDGLNYNSDGSLDIYIQANSPGQDKESNWLPSPATGKLGVTMRLYAPKSPALDGRWNPPVIKKVVNS